jgi:predicted hydrocarbon binding protein
MKKGQAMNRKQFFKQSLLAGLTCCGSAMGFAKKLERGNPQREAVSLTDDLTRRIRDGAKSPDWRKMEEALVKFRAMMDHMDAQLDEETKINILNACGRSCFINAFGVAAERKPSPEQAEAYLKALEQSGIEVRREQETISVFYRWGAKQNPYGLSMKEGYCMCPIVESGAAGMSKSYCNCSAGYVKEGMERATGKSVLKVEVLESILQGGKDCRFKVVIRG